MALATTTSTATLTTRTSSLSKPYQHLIPITNFSFNPPSKSPNFISSICCVMAPDRITTEKNDLTVIQRPDSFGRFGKFGGKYVPETLMYALSELEFAFRSLSQDSDFQV